MNDHPLTPAIEYLAEFARTLDDDPAGQASPAARESVRIAQTVLEFTRRRAKDTT